MARSTFGSIDKLPSGRWRARYEWPTGRRHKAPNTFVTKADARYWLTSEQRLISQGTWTAPEERAAKDKARPLTFAQYAARILDRRQSRAVRPLRPLTRQDYEKLLNLHVLPVLGALPLAAITPAVISDWYEDAAPGHTTTRGKSYDLVRSIFNDAVNDGILPASPCRLRGAGKPRRSKAVDALPADVLVQYLAAAPEHYRTMLYVAATCALRSGELRGLRRRDVDLKAGVLHIRQQVIKPTRDHHLVYEFAPVKTDAGRRDIAMPDVVAEAMRQWIKDHPVTGPDALVFPAGDGHSPMNDSTLNRNHKRTAAAIGRPNLTIHDMRRTAATLAAQGGATTYEVMRLLGHTRPDVAMLYQRTDAERDRERAGRLDGVLRSAREASPMMTEPVPLSRVSTRRR